MSHAVDTDRCMFFVGGNDYKSNSPSGEMLAGGCTKAWWDSQPNIDTVAGKQTAMGKLMGSDGEPISTVSNTIHTDNGSGKVKITDGDGGGFSGVEAGMLLYHPDSVAELEGPGLYKIIEVDAINGDYIVLDQVSYGYEEDDDGDVVLVGGAWDSLGDLCSLFVDAGYYTQEVFVNKDLSPSVQWDWSNWSGDVYNNTWLKVFGFHRVPGDITDPGGAYFQTAKSMKEDGVHADKLVEVDMSGLSVDLIEPDYSENITLRGFYFNNAPAGVGIFDLAVAAWSNIDLEHNAFEISIRMDTAKCRNLLLSDSCITPSGIYVDVIINMDASSVVIFLNNYIKHDNPSVGINVPLGAIYVGIGNIVDFGGAASGILSTAVSTVVSLNNTYTGFDSSYGQGTFRVNNEGTFISVNDIIFNKVSGAYALEVAKFGGSFITKNLCAYSEAGQLDEVIELHPDEPTGNIQKHDVDNLLEIDPMLNSGYRPRNKKILLGGTEVGGQRTTIGAISQEHQFVGRSLKSNPGRLGTFK